MVCFLLEIPDEIPLTSLPTTLESWDKCLKNKQKNLQKKQNNLPEVDKGL